jgi:hypothetical protein
LLVSRILSFEIIGKNKDLFKKPEQKQCGLYFGLRLRTLIGVSWAVRVESNSGSERDKGINESWGNSKIITNFLKKRKMKNQTADQKPLASKHHHKLLTGATMDKYPIMLDNGKTIIFISDLSKEAEIRQKYLLRAQQNVAR